MLLSYNIASTYGTMNTINIEGVFMKSGIYKIFSIATGESYYGSSRNCRNRFNGHKSGWRRGKGNYRIKDLLEKYGKDNFEFSIVELCAPEFFEEREKYYIDNDDKCLNVWVLPFSPKGCELGPNVKGKHFSGYVHTEEQKKESSRRMKEYYKNNYSYWKGKSIPKSAKEKISSTLKKYFKENECATKGIPKNKDHKKKLSESLKKHFLTNDSPMKGRKMSEGTRNKLSSSLKKRWKEKGHPCIGRILSKESKLKMSLSIKAALKKKREES